MLQSGVRFLLETVAAVVLGYPVWRLMDLVSSTPSPTWISESLLIIVAVIAVVAIVLLVWDLTRGFRGKWGVSKTEEPAKTVPVVVPSAAEIKKELGFELRAKRDLPNIDMLLKDVKDNGHVWVMGIDCSQWLTGSPSRISKLVRDRNLSFTFLLAAQGTKNIKIAESAELISPQSDDTHSRNVKLFNSIRNTLGDNKHKFRLGVYDLPLVRSLTVLNANIEDEQIIVVDHYLYSVDPGVRPSLILKRAQLSDQLRDIFDQYRKSIDYVMRNTKDQDGKPLF
jgi:hypothetical protein